MCFCGNQRNDSNYMPFSELPSSELPNYGELGRLDGVVPAEKKPEIPRSIVHVDIEDFLREQEERDRKNNPKRPTIH